MEAGKNAKDENAQWREEAIPRYRIWKDHARASWQAPPSGAKVLSPNPTSN